MTDNHRYDGERQNPRLSHEEEGKLGGKSEVIKP
jgi:hypothetical protein